MPDNMSAVFDRLRASTLRLNQATDAAAQMVRDVEAYLEESGVGIDASVEVYPLGDPTEEPTGSFRLAYRRIHGKYRVAVVEVHFRDRYSEETARAWSESTREERLESFRELPNLMAAIADRVEQQAGSAEKILTEVVAALPQPKKRKGGA